MCLVFVALAVLSTVYGQVIQLECPAETQGLGSLTCNNPQVCDDEACGKQSKVCCATTKPGECGFTCSVGDYKGCYVTTWFCYGTTAAGNPLPKRYSSSAFYIDNQDGVLDAGTVKEIKYHATRTDVEVEFMLLAPSDQDGYEYRMTSYSVRHTASKTGEQKINVEWSLNQRDFRLAFRTETGTGEFPIPYTNYQANGLNRYHSFIDPTINGQQVSVASGQKVPGGRNIRFQARACLNSGLDLLVPDTCGYVPPTSPTTPATSSTTSKTTTTSSTTEEGPDPICQREGCEGQAIVQEDGDVTERATAGSYTYVDFSGEGEIREGFLNFIEYRVTRLTPVLFQIWEETEISRAMFKLYYQMTLNPQNIGFNRVNGLDIEVREKMRFGFTYVVTNGNNSVPIQYVQRNVENGGVETDRPYLGAECAQAGCGSGLQPGAMVQLTDRQSLVQKQFLLRPCRYYFFEGQCKRK